MPKTLINTSFSELDAKKIRILAIRQYAQSSVYQGFRDIQIQNSNIYKLVIEEKSDRWRKASIY